MKMMKTILPLCLLATVCIPATADDQERAFGKGGLHGTRSGSTQNKQPSKQQLWQNDQSYALALAKRAENGDTTAPTPANKDVEQIPVTPVPLQLESLQQ